MATDEEPTPNLRAKRKENEEIGEKQSEEEIIVDIFGGTNTKDGKEEEENQIRG